MSDGGKGSKPRPIKVSDQEYELRWDAIFAIPIDSETDKPTRNNAETQQVQNFKVDNSGKSLL
jgi:thiamine biosynthesis protein ThiC